MKTQEIKAANPQGKMTMVSGTNNIEFENGVILTSTTGKEKTKLWNKLLKMGYQRYINTASDEMKGYSEAKPESVYNYQIIEK